MCAAPVFCTKSRSLLKSAIVSPRILCYTFVALPTVPVGGCCPRRYTAMPLIPPYSPSSEARLTSRAFISRDVNRLPVQRSRMIRFPSGRSIATDRRPAVVAAGHSRIPSKPMDFTMRQANGIRAMRIHMNSSPGSDQYASSAGGRCAPSEAFVIRISADHAGGSF